MQLSGAVLPVPEGFEEELDRQWAFLAGPGSTMTGEERVAVVATARAALDGGESAEGPVGRAAARIATAAHTITADWVEELLADGIHRDQLIEIIGLVSRHTAIDTAVRGLGAERLPLPEPIPGPPTGERDDAAKKRGAFLPTVGAANPVSVLSALPGELDHQLTLSNAIYLSLEQMMDLDIERGLHRTQMELVAGRTSRDNECFY